MKLQFLLIGLAVIVAFSAVACTAEQPADGLAPEDGGALPPAQTETDPADVPDSTEHSGGKTLVAFFSATGNTRPIAESAADILSADLYEIVPQDLYTEADLAYYTDCRADREQNDDTARPAISGKVENMEDYDTVLIGYPIWHGRPPKIIYTFLESYDFSGKTIVPFCTSGSSPYSDSGIRELAGGAAWLTGRRFAAGAGREEVAGWLAELELPAQAGGETLSITVNGQALTADLADNSSAQALRELLADGPLTIEMHDYGNMEKVGPLGTELPRNDEQITTEAGDLILYQGNSLVIYYAPNSWNFTRLGKLKNVGAQELKDILGAGDVSVILSLGE